MTWNEFLESVSNSALGTAIREGATTFAWIEGTHVLMVTTVLGTIAIVDLRLLGYPAHRRGAKQLIKDMLPFTWAAFVLAVITGVALFTSNAVNYWDSNPFRWKMIALFLAGLNMAVFHLTAYRRIAEWDESLPPPITARVAGITSLGLWVLVAFLGRWIGFSAPMV
jgi:hypothetical protein